jgi:HlyD family secretion protein
LVLVRALRYTRPIMGRILSVLAVAIVALSLGLAARIRANAAIDTAPTGGSGTIEGTDVQVSARLAARVLAVPVVEGQAVAKGDVIATLDCAEPEATLEAAEARRALAESAAEAAAAQARAALSQAEAAAASVDATGAQAGAVRANRDLSAKQAARVKRLEVEGNATESDLDRASGQLEQLTEQLRGLEASGHAQTAAARAARAQSDAARHQAEAALAQIAAARADVTRARIGVAECTLVAPIAGIVETRAIEPGEVTLPGTRVARIVGLDVVETTFYVPNAELGRVAAGRRATLRADAYGERRFDAVVARVASEAEFTPRNVQTRKDRDRLVYAVTLRVENADHALRPGMPVEVELAP